jgi:hypothetical protein
LVISGKLLVNGTTGHEVYFTSYRDDTIGGDTNGDGASTGNPGDWGWIEFSPSSDSSSLIDYAVIRYGGYSSSNGLANKGDLYINGASPGIQNTVLELSYHDGIYSDENSQPVLVCNTIQQNNDFGLRNITPATVIDAINQFWGTPSGPYHPTLNPTGLGNEVSDGVNFIPWKIKPCGAPPVIFNHFIYLPFQIR